jgi:hypothetical protein
MTSFHFEAFVYFFVREIFSFEPDIYIYEIFLLKHISYH